MNKINHKICSYVYKLYSNGKLRDQYVKYFKDGTIGIQMDIGGMIKHV